MATSGYTRTKNMVSGLIYQQEIPVHIFPVSPNAIKKKRLVSETLAKKPSAVRFGFF